MLADGVEDVGEHVANRAAAAVGAGQLGAIAAWRARQCVSATSADRSSSEVWASSARISTVPSRGCGRSFHQNHV
jgi:hypothetical protein